MIGSIDPSKAHTFRKGRVGSWREEMSAANQQLFDDTAGWLLPAMGYNL
jgi:hypothetical protein